MSGRVVLKACTGALLLPCIAGLARAAAMIGLRVPLDPNEGWNAYHALHAMSGAALYPAANTLLYNNYPPLSYYAVGALGSIVGGNIVAGRLLSLLATLAVAAGIVLTARRMRVDAAGAAFAAVLFVAGLLVFTDYVGMDDPQLFGHAVAMAGLVVLLNAPRSWRAAIGAALLMTLAVYIKHNLFVLPIALALWLALYDRRAAVPFAASGLAFALLGLAMFRLVYGTSLLDHLDSPRVWSFDLLAASLANWLVWADVALFAMAALLVLKREDSYVVFTALYASVAIFAAVLFAGGAGVDMNIWFDAMIALSLGTALAVNRIVAKKGWAAFAAVVFALPLAAGVALNWDDAWLERDFWLRPMSSEARTARADIAFLQRQEGPALCEMLSLCYWAGKAEEADVFNLGQAYATKARGDDALVRALDRQYYKSIEFDSLDDFALTPRVRQVLLRRYRIDHRNDEGVFLLPR